MNYQKIYNSIIERARYRKLDCYTEKHHVIPRCLGGADDVKNIVELTPEEHYVCHQILCKIYPDNLKLVNAAMLMTKHTTFNRVNNKLFGWLRKKASQLSTGITKSEETKQKMRKPKSLEHRKNISLAQKLNGGNGPKFHTEETKRKQREWSLGRTVIKLECPHCGKIGGNNVMKQWHYDNCNKIKKREQKQEIQCPYCFKIGRGSAMKQWHFDNCKHKESTHEQN